MIREFFETKEQAERRALAYLSRVSKLSGEEYSTLETTAKTGKGEEIYTLIQNEDEEGAFTFITQTSESWRIDGYPNNRFTYPFRGIGETGMYIASLLGADFVKPTKEITIKEARTAKGATLLYSYFGLSTKIEEGELPFIPIPIVEAETDTEIKTENDYVEALKELAQEAEGRNLKEEYSFLRAEYFTLFCLYEFLRTEKYSDLKENLKKYKSFGLWEDWEETYPPFATNGEAKAENYILARYLSKVAREKGKGINSIRLIAEYIEAPVGLLYGLNKRVEV